MATITEDYVSFEIAKLLKEKGFDNISSIMYKENGEMCINPKSVVSWRLKYWYPCLTLQMAMKWLREKHNLFITIDCGVGAYVWSITIISNRNVVLKVGAVVSSYEQACEAAIKYCLKHLI